MLIDDASLVTTCFPRDTERLANKWALPRLPISDRRHRPLPVVLKELVTSLRGKLDDNSPSDFEIPEPMVSQPGAAEQSSAMEESIIDSETSRIQDKATDAGPGSINARQPGQDPLWAIADVMLAKVEELFAQAVKEHPSAPAADLAEGPDVSGMLHAMRVTENEVCPPSIRAILHLLICLRFQALYAAVSQAGSQKRRCAGIVSCGNKTDSTHFKVCIQLTSPETPGSRALVQTFRLPDHTSIVNLGFFDDNDLAVALRVDNEDGSPGEFWTNNCGPYGSDLLF